MANIAYLWMAFNFLKQIFLFFFQSLFFQYFFLIPVQLCSDHTYFSKFFCNRILYFQFVPKLCESYLDQEVPRLMFTRWAGVWRSPQNTSESCQMVMIFPENGPSWGKMGGSCASCCQQLETERLWRKERKPSFLSKLLFSSRNLDGKAWSEEDKLSL